jgi:hypothetical protein
MEIGMRLFTAFCAAALVLGQGGGATPGDPIPGIFQKSDIDLDIGVPPPWTTGVKRPGDLHQFSLTGASGKKGDSLKTLRVTVTGDAVTVVALVEAPVRTQPTSAEPNGRPDPSKKNVSCFVKAVKAGESTVKIVAVGEDGRELLSREYRMRVIPAKGRTDDPKAKEEEKPPQ